MHLFDLRRVWIVLIAALVLCGCAANPPAQQQTTKPAMRRGQMIDRLTDSLVTMLPLDYAFDHFAAKDPTWPFPGKANAVTKEQMACMRKELSAAGFRQTRHHEAEAYAKDHPSHLQEDIELLEGGAAATYGKLVKAGIDAKISGTAADSNAVLKSMRSEQLLSFMTFTKDPAYGDLRKLAGIGDSIGDAASKEEGKKAGRQIGSSLASRYMLQAAVTCNVPPSAYL